jgi:hypothetical protein
MHVCAPKARPLVDRYTKGGHLEYPALIQNIGSYSVGGRKPALALESRLELERQTIVCRACCTAGKATEHLYGVVISGLQADPEVKCRDRYLSAPV